MRRIIIRYRNKEDYKDFCTNIKLPYNEKIKTLYYPSLRVGFSESKYKDRTIRNKIQYEWNDMPEYLQEEREPYKRIEAFIQDEYFESFARFIDQKIHKTTLSIWYPKITPFSVKYKRIMGEGDAKYPIYVVSKGRYERSWTSIHLIKMEVPHFIVVEPNEVEKYNETVGRSKFCTVLELDMKFKDEYDTFDDLGDTKGKGPGGARNFCWQHSIDNGHKWHWVLDDNVVGFFLLNRNAKIPCGSGILFKMAEDFVDRYDNVAIAGLNYNKFALADAKLPPYVLNTRIYSMLLIRNDIKYRWRGRYNEDTDICLRVLKDGWATIQFNSFLGDKMATQQMGGGNSDMFYFKEGTMPKSKMLEDMHPDVAKVVWKFSRWHHYVNYAPFKDIDPKLKPNYKKYDYKLSYINIGKDIYGTEKDTKSYIEANCKPVTKEEFYNLESYEEQYKPKYSSLFAEGQYKLQVKKEPVKQKKTLLDW